MYMYVVDEADSVSYNISTSSTVNSMYILRFQLHVAS